MSVTNVWHSWLTRLFGGPDNGKDNLPGPSCPIKRPKEDKKDSGTLGLEQFLKIMTTQLKSQDPLEPMDNGDFLGQIAQFGTVTGIENLNESFGSFSSSITNGQALQAGTLVGREVLAPVSTCYLETGSSIKGRVDLPSSRIGSCRHCLCAIQGHANHRDLYPYRMACCRAAGFDDPSGQRFGNIRRHRANCQCADPADQRCEQGGQPGLGTAPSCNSWQQSPFDPGQRPFVPFVQFVAKIPSPASPPATRQRASVSTFQRPNAPPLSTPIPAPPPTFPPPESRRKDLQTTRNHPISTPQTLKFPPPFPETRTLVL